MMNSRVFISTGGFSGLSAYDAAFQLRAGGIDAIELSGGLPFNGLEEQIRTLSVDGPVTLHNYLPLLPNDFVLNLASPRAEIGDLSLTLCKRCIDLASAIGARTYSVHAGFLVDPQVKELGAKLAVRNVSNRNEATDRFVERVEYLNTHARGRGVRLLLENNVLNADNHARYGMNPLLMADPDEVEMIMARLPDDVGLLLDIGHLNVSAKTLGFDPVSALQHLSRYVHGYHLSENDGLEDTNQPITEWSWFWEYLKRDCELYTIEVYNVPVSKLRLQREIAMKTLGL